MDGSIVIGYRWARTVLCQNPKCKAKIPLLKNYYLVNKDTKKLFLLPIVKNKKIIFKIVGNGYDDIPNNFNPTKGSISNGKAICQVCKTVLDGQSVKSQFREKKSSEILISVMSSKTGSKKKNHRIATNKDVEIFNNCLKYLTFKEKILRRNWNIEPIPNEPTPFGDGSGAERAFAVRNYSFNAWGDLFNSRQKLCIITFCEKIRLAHNEMIKNGYTKEYSKIISSYLAIILDKLIDKNSNLVRYLSTSEASSNVFGRGVLPMIWDYCELNPFANVGWLNMANRVKNVIEHVIQLNSYSSPIDLIQPTIKISQNSATSLPFQNNFLDAVITDPPYYDNIPYSHLSDFFYVWLKRSIGYLYPELFSTPLTPKSNEIVAYGNIEGGLVAGKIFFEKMLEKSFQEIYRVLKSEGIAVIVYAHKSTDGWESLIRSILASGLVVTAAWPIHTEMKTRLTALNTASLSSSIYMIARKHMKEQIGFYSNIKKDLDRYLEKKLELLWNENIAGADFLIAAIGSAIEVFGKYEKILDDADRPIEIPKLLNDTREIVTNYAIKQVLHGSFTDQISQMTRFYLLWRWAYGEAKVPFDDALKMAQSVGIDIEKNYNKGFIKKQAEYISVIGPTERDTDLSKSDELIDILHMALSFWKNKQKSSLDNLVKNKKLEKNNMLKRICQAISESLSLESLEKRWLDGFIIGFLGEESKQTKLL